uniref:DUF148 domain-containing protein n=1 Tax=Rhabditophanes sp. KR3021 TaxID=114890 RepID=A0AC35TK41_9BILA
MQSKNILLVLALTGALLAFPQDRREGGEGKEMGGFKNGKEGGFSFFLQNATQTTKTQFEEIQRNHTLSRNAKTAATDALIANDAGEGVQSGYATFKTEMTAKWTALKATIDANITASNLTTAQKTLIQNFEAIYTNGDLTPEAIKTQAEALKTSADPTDLQAVEEFFKSLKKGFGGKFGGAEEHHDGMNGNGESHENERRHENSTTQAP